MPQVKCEYAYIPDTEIPVHAKGAPQVDYECPTCGGKMYVIPKKRVQSPHFHHRKGRNHDIKSIIHDNAKLFLLDLLQKLHDENKDIFIEYTWSLKNFRQSYFSRFIS